MIERVRRVVDVRHHAEHALEHRTRLADFLARGRDRPHIIRRLLGNFVQPVHVGLHRVDRRLALIHLLERSRELRFDRLPLGEPLLELRHPLLREAQAARAIV